MRKQRSLSPQRLASRFVDAQEPFNIGDMIANGGAHWQALTDAIRRTYRGVLSNDEIIAEQQAIGAALSNDEARDRFGKLCDTYVSLECVATDAAFLVGLEVGRRGVRGEVA